MGAPRRPAGPPKEKRATQGSSEYPEDRAPCDKTAGERLFHRYVYDGVRLAQRETHAKGDRGRWHAVPLMTRFVQTFPGGRIVYADCDCIVDVQMTDRFGKPWFMYRGREGFQEDSAEARKLRNTGLQKALPLPSWPYMEYQPWYQRVMEPDLVLGRRGARGREGF